MNKRKMITYCIGPYCNVSLLFNRRINSIFLMMFLFSTPQDTHSRSKIEDLPSSWSCRWSNFFLFKLFPCYPPWWSWQEWIHYSSKTLISSSCSINFMLNLLITSYRGTKHMLKFKNGEGNEIS